MIYKDPKSGHIESDGFSVAYSGKDDYNKFTKKFPERTLGPKQKETLADFRAILKVRKHLKVKITTNPTPEQMIASEAKDKEAKKDIIKLYGAYRAIEKRDTGY